MTIPGLDEFFDREFENYYERDEDVGEFDDYHKEVEEE